jgi:hypothetical protein
MKPAIWMACGVLMAWLALTPGGVQAAQAPPPADEAEEHRPPQAYYVPEQEDVEEWGRERGGPAAGWGWLGRVFKGKPGRGRGSLDERPPDEDQAP